MKRNLEAEHKMAVDRKHTVLSEDEKMQREQYTKRYEEIIDNLKVSMVGTLSFTS